MADMSAGVLRRRAVDTQFLRPYVRSARVRAGFGILALLLLLAVLAPILGRYDPVVQDVGPVLQSPAADHPFGTDNFGRDVFARVLFGGRSSLSIAVLTVLLATVLGVPLGLLAGLYGGRVDTLVSRVVDMLQAFPSLILAISVVALLGPGFANVILALGIVYAPSFARLARSGVLTVRELPYVTAARAIGDDNWSILREQILPNVLSPIIVQGSTTLAYALLAEAGLSFLGLGTQPPDPSWGRMLSEARSLVGRAPWLVVFPGSFVMLAVMGFNLLGDGLRDALDPRFRDLL